MAKIEPVSDAAPDDLRMPRAGNRSAMALFMNCSRETRRQEGHGDHPQCVNGSSQPSHNRRHDLYFYIFSDFAIVAIARDERIAHT